MLAAVQLHMKGLLDGLLSPQLPPLEALVQPPVLSDVADHPYAFVWGGRGKERRQTAPRVRQIRPAGGLTSGGYQEMTWTIDILVFSVMAQEDPTIETAFPGLFDAVLLELNTCDMPVITADPVTGQQSQILTIGESIDTDYATALVTSNTHGQGIVRFGASFAVEVKEKSAWSEGMAG